MYAPIRLRLLPVAVMLASCVPISHRVEDSVVVPAQVPASKQQAFAKAFVTQARYERMRAAAQQALSLTTEQEGALFLQWRTLQQADGADQVLIVVGVTYRGHYANVVGVVSFCRQFIEKELQSAALDD